MKTNCDGENKISMHDLVCEQEPEQPAETLLDQQLGQQLNECERQLLLEIIHAMRTIKYGNIVLTMHDGRFVELSKTIRLRKTK